MARISKLLVGVWLAGMFASGSALAGVFDLGQLTPGPAAFATIGAPVTPGVPFDDKFAFDVIGIDGLLGGSFLSSQILPDGSDGFFDINVQVFKWNPGTSKFVEISGVAANPIQFFDTGISVTAAQGGDTSVGGIDRAYYVEVFGTADVIAPGQVSGYGGSILIAAVPEPSTTLFLLGGVLLAAVIGRRRLTGK